MPIARSRAVATAMVNGAAGEECDDAGESATCDDDCTVVACGDGNTQRDSGEECDTAGESGACDSDCTAGRLWRRLRERGRG